jgi:conjugal transfer/entry exclusion protein
MQVNEMRQLRAFMAVSIQASTQGAMKDEKAEQTAAEMKKQFFDGSSLKSQYQGY